MDTERITYEIQQMKGSATARTRSIGSTSPPSMSEANATDDDGRSIITVSAQSEAGIHTAQISVATPSSGADTSIGTADSPQEQKRPRKTKRQLWDDLTISCELGPHQALKPSVAGTLLTISPNQQSLEHTPFSTLSACSRC